MTELAGYNKWGFHIIVISCILQITYDTKTTELLTGIVYWNNGGSYGYK